MRTKGLHGFAIHACVLGALVISASALQAQTREAPYWVSLKFDEVRMRVGPSQEYPIEWLYKREGLPLKVVRVREGWRLVQDPDGAQGWIARSQLSDTRTAMVVGEGLATLREEPSATSNLRWRAEPGVVGKLLTCRGGWCEIDVIGRTGWVEAQRLWGDEELMAQEGA
ncbi:MAG: SH3 domain-containing protein [Pseudomonadota bacterium]